MNTLVTLVYECMNRSFDWLIAYKEVIYYSHIMDHQIILLWET